MGLTREMSDMAVAIPSIPAFSPTKALGGLILSLERKAKRLQICALVLGVR